MRKHLLCLTVVFSLFIPWLLASCGPVYHGLAGVSKMMPEGKSIKCPYCKKEITEEDVKCPFCGRDVRFDMGGDTIPREVQRMDAPPQR